MEVSRFTTRHPVTVSPEDTIERAVELMEQHGFRHLPVREGDLFVGLLSDRDVMLGTGGHKLSELGLGQDENVVNRVADIMSRALITVSADERAPTAAGRMVSQRVGALPVLEDGQPVGIVTETDLIKAFADACRDPAVADELDVDLGSVMRPSTVSVRSDDTVADAVQQLTDWSIRHVPVLDDEELVGIVSDRDVRLSLGRDMVADALAQRDGKVHMDAATIAAIMTKDPYTAAPHVTLSQAVQIMLEHHVSAVPVCVDGLLLGIVTRTDVLEHYAGVA